MLSFNELYGDAASFHLNWRKMGCEQGIESKWHESGGKVSVAERLLDPARGGVNRDMTGAGGGHVTGRKFHIQHMFEFCIASIHFKMS